LAVVVSLYVRVKKATQIGYRPKHVAHNLVRLAPGKNLMRHRRKDGGGLLTTIAA
jgi:hypothetical protein